MNRPTPALRIAGLRIGALFELYRWRLRQYKVQELLAGLGIATGVALFFSVLIANTSLIGSASQLVRSVAGSADFEVAARSPEGFEERLAQRASRLPGVKVAAPVLRHSAEVRGPAGNRAVQLVGVTTAQVELGGRVTRNLGEGTRLLGGGIALPASIANDIAARGGDVVELVVGGTAHRTLVSAVAGSQLIGPVANSPVVIASLVVAQRLTGDLGRVTEMLVEAKPGARQVVARELRRLAAGRLDVVPANQEVSVLKATATPTSESTLLFAAISAMVGLLLALNAVLLTVPERRRFVADLREQGYGPRQVLVILCSQAIALGVIASLAGIGLGYLFSGVLFHDAPSYLTFAFPIGTHLLVPLGVVALAIACGVLATVLASLLPLVDLRRDRVGLLRVDPGEPGQRIRGRTIAACATVGCVLTGSVTVLVLAVPSLSVAGGVALAIATFCFIPPLFVVVVRAIGPFSERIRGSMLALATVELEGTATRSIALAGVAALAVYGTVAIQGARGDLVTGLDTAVVQYLDTADIWVTPNNNFLTIDGFAPGRLPRTIASLPGITSVHEYQGQLLDVGTRRLWIRARPASDDHLLQASQLLQGEDARATALIRRGGWVAVSSGLVNERRLHLGGPIELPTPSGDVQFGIAAITTNVGWPPGAITLNAQDYRRYWHQALPSALEVSLRPGTSPASVKAAIDRRLGTQNGLLVETFEERKRRYDESARQGIQSLNEICTLLLIASAMAIAAALSAALWQRRRRLAALRSMGFDTPQLWRSLLLESAILLGIGCLDGVVFGVYGHALASRWLEKSVGFPAPFALSPVIVVATVGVLTSVALAVIALPGLAAARAPHGIGFQE